jgi:hypothetical protein
MKKITGFVLALFTIITACNSSTNSKRGDPKKTGTQAASPKIVLPKAFFKKLKGTIGGTASITMDLETKEMDYGVSGSYYYNGIGTPILLDGKVLPSGEITLTEKDEKGKDSGKFSGRFISAESIEGTWTNIKTGKQLPFKLTETKDGFADIKYEDFRNDDCSTRDEMLKKPKEITNEYDTTCTTLTIHLLTISIPNRKISNLINDTIVSYITGDKHTSIKAFLNAGGSNDSGFIEQEYDCYMVTNDSNVFSVELRDSQFTGGSHGNGTYNYVNFDLITGKKITLNDILKPNYTDKLNQVAAKIFFTGNNEGWNVDEDSFELNGNFAITTGGLLFGFQEYEIGSYVQGSPQVLIPYSKIKNLVKQGGILTRFTGK